MEFGINIIRYECDRFAIEMLPSSNHNGKASVTCSIQELEELKKVITEALGFKNEFSVEFE